MGAWSGGWNLNVATAEYGNFKVGKFSLKKLPNQAGKFEVTTTSGAAAAKWLGAVFTAVSDAGEPELPWPLPASPSIKHKTNAGRYLREKMELQMQLFDSLQGQVTVDGQSQVVHLFKINGATVEGDDFLLCYTKDDLDGITAPGGSASGVRP